MRRGDPRPPLALCRFPAPLRASVVAQPCLWAPFVPLISNPSATLQNFGPLNYATMGAKSGRNFPDTLEIARHMVEVYDQENAACSDLV